MLLIIYRYYGLTLFLFFTLFLFIVIKIHCHIYKADLQRKVDKAKTIPKS